jgi:hypothetical protein
MIGILLLIIAAGVIDAGKSIKLIWFSHPFICISYITSAANQTWIDCENAARI